MIVEQAQSSTREEQTMCDRCTCYVLCSSLPLAQCLKSVPYKSVAESHWSLDVPRLCEREIGTGCR